MSEENRKIFIGSLHHSITEFNFAKHFHTYGELEDVVILKERSGRSKGCGFITYTEPEMAQAALSAGIHIIDGRKVDVKPALPKGATELEKNGQHIPKNFQKVLEPSHKLYVRNLGSYIRNDQLKRYFSIFGSLQNAYISKYPDKTSKGFGFVFFQDEESVEKVQKNRPHFIGNRAIVTIRGYPDDTPAEDKKPSHKLRVLNYEDRIEVKDIEEYFKKFGKIVATISKTDRRNNTKHVELEFEDYDIVDKILLTKNHSIKNCNLMVQKHLEKKQEEPKCKSMTKVDASKNKSSRSSSVLLENLETQKQRTSLKKTPSIQTTVNAPCAPPLEDLLKPRVNPTFENRRPSQLQPSEPSYQSISNAATDHIYHSDGPINGLLYPNLVASTSQKNQRKNNNGCVVS